MTDVNANIIVNIDSSAALVNLRKLETQIDQFQRRATASNTAAAASQQALNRALLDGINNTGLFSARAVNVQDSMAKLSSSIDKAKLSLGEYTRFAASQLPGMSRVFRREFDLMGQVAESRVKKMQTQYIALGKTVDGVTRAIAATPTGLAKGYATDVAIATQRQQLFNRMIDDGSTKLLNWGKNTQWAGRQLMVGFSIPLAALGAVAAKTFMEIDKATVSLRRVYGDLSTTTEEVNNNVDAIRTLGKEYTKYGISVSETINISARAAATGATNEKLMAATEQTMRFATLGQMDYNQALDTTISLQTAFGISNEDLGKKVDYLNAVENQTVLTMEDMSLAIPRVATVVKGLGGDVEDLAIMMTAMKEGGISAENAANGLKSGLASLINPTKRAKESMADLGININSIISSNKGNLMGLVTDFGSAINSLDQFSRQQVLEKVFGKFQFARMSALFTNITNDAGQAARAMDIAGMSVQQLADLAERELGVISESTSVKFQAAMENLKNSIAPVGEAFLKGLTPVMNFVSKVADAFNSLPDGVKNATAIITAALAGIAPVVLMGFGLLGNGFANLIKTIQFFRRRIAGIKGDADSFRYLAMEELQAVTATEALEGAAGSLTGKLLLQKGAVRALTEEYSRFAQVAGVASGAMGRAGGRGGRPSGGSAKPPLRMATGGMVPGTGNKDTIPALLTPGESVITKKATQKYAPVLEQMNKGTLPGFYGGGVKISRSMPQTQRSQMLSSLGSNYVNKYSPRGLTRGGNRKQRVSGFNIGLV
jgi:TP901 family phage tail tape measure protein